jgi:hypothetical protein
VQLAVGLPSDNVLSARRVQDLDWREQGLALIELKLFTKVAVGTIIADRPPHRSVRALISAYGSYLG